MEPILDAPESNISDKNFSYAGFWIRFGAYFIDGLCLMIVQIAVAFIVTGTSGFGGTNIGLTLFNLLVGITYFAVMESSSYQATLGKMAVGLKVVDSNNGERISLGKGIGRYFGRILSSIILFIGFIMIAFNDKKQSLHDKIVNTYVVRK